MHDALEAAAFRIPVGASPAASARTIAGTSQLAGRLYGSLASSIPIVQVSVTPAKTSPEPTKAGSAANSGLKKSARNPPVAAKAPAAREAHPRTEHWAPLYVALGVASVDGDVAGASVVDGFWYGLSKRSWQFA